MGQPAPRNDLAKQQPQPQKPPERVADTGDTNSLEALFERSRPLMEKLAPKFLTVDRLIKVALMARSRNDLLRLCTAESLLRCVLQAAEIGLEPSGTYGGIHLVPRKNGKTGKYEATIVVDYRGLVELARRSGEIAAVEAGGVYEADEFAFERGLTPMLRHQPALRGERGDFLGCWAVVFYKDGTKTFEVMRRDEVEAVRNKVPYHEKGPWGSHFEAMAKKTVVKRAMNLAPKSPEYRRAEEIEDEMEGVVVPAHPELAALPSQTGVQVDLRQTRSQRMAAELKARVVDVQPGESEEEAEARFTEEPPEDMDLPVPEGTP